MSTEWTHKNIIPEVLLFVPQISKLLLSYAVSFKFSQNIKLSVSDIKEVYNRLQVPSDQ